MDIILLCKILAALEWQNCDFHTERITDYISSRYQEIFKETQDIYYHLYLEL